MITLDALSLFRFWIAQVNFDFEFPAAPDPDLHLARRQWAPNMTAEGRAKPTSHSRGVPACPLRPRAIVIDVADFEVRVHSCFISEANEF